MQFRIMFALIVAGVFQVDLIGSSIFSGARPVFAAEDDAAVKKAAGNWLPSGDVLGFTQKGQPFAIERTIPGLVGALLLTEEQKQKLQAAVAETVQSEAVLAAGRGVKSNPNATEAEKDEARRKTNEAREKLQQLVSGILTAEQRSLVDRLNSGVADAQREVYESMQADFASAKGNDEQQKQLREQMQKRVIDNFKSRLSTLTTAVQQAGLEKAAAAQAAADATPSKPKVK